MARPVLAALIRLFVLIVPAVAGMLAAWGVTRLLADPSGTAEIIGWWVALVAAAVTAVVVTQRLAKRLLPLAWLLHLTLAFPDRAPSRLNIARRAARGRTLRHVAAEAREEGLGEDPASAAGRALVLVAALGAHDRRTRGHSERVRGLADVLAEEAGVPEEDRDRLRWAALLHDIGKLAVPGEILNKPDRPDDAEWETLRRHPEEGDRLVAPLVAWLGPWAAAVAHHHEHWDGSGYPRGLAGEDISLGGRILAIADAYEVMTAARPYKAPQGPHAARKELVTAAGAHFDPVLVRHFLAVSLGKLWWLIGGSAVLSLVPWLAGLWTNPAGAAIRRTGSGPVTAAAALGALALAGVVAPAATPLRSEPAPVEAAAPAAPPTTVPPLPPGAVTAAEVLSSLAPPTTTTVPAKPVVIPPAPPPASSPVADPPPAPPAATVDSPVEPEPPQPAPPDEPPPGPLFRGGGTLILPGLLGLTSAEMQAGCGSPVTQGVDAMVFELPPEARVAGAPVRAVGSDLLGLHNLDVAFYSEDCELLGELAGPEPDETGALPSGTRFVVVADRLGIATTIEFSVG
ncbi:MAG: HD-GYP domain-containing protein [Acidimicrobiia bacterium]